MAGNDVIVSMTKEEAVTIIRDLIYSTHRCTIDIERVVELIFNSFESREKED